MRMSGQTWRVGQWVAGVAVPALAALALGLLPAQGQQGHRNGFEGLKPAWIKGKADVEFIERKHETTTSAVHQGQRSEFIQIEAKQGSHIYYLYPTGRAPIGEELTIQLWVKANRPGLQLLARVVLPHERDPNSLEDRLTTIIKGDTYRLAGRWQRLEIGRTVALCKQQQQLMQGQLKRPINFTDAYVDTLILNVYGGPGLNEVWLDDLEVGPLAEPLVQQPVMPATPGGPVPQARPAARTSLVQFTGTQLQIDDKKIFFRGIRHTDTPLDVLRQAGFNTLWVDYTAPPTLLKEAVDHGFWLVPTLPVTLTDAQLVSRHLLAQEVGRLAESNAILFWDLGRSLEYREETLARLTRAAQQVRAADPGRPLGVNVWDGLLPYSRAVNLVGVHRWPLMTELGLAEYREWLDQRRRLATPGSFLWTWVQTHLPDWHARLLYDQPASAPFKEPVGPQPEQIRLLTFTALGAGCRGLAYWSDRFLADSHQGRDRLLGLAVLNQELQMLEPLLVTVEESPQWIETSLPEVRAAVFRTSTGVLVLPMWLGKGAQYVPGQSAATKVSLVVPSVPQGTQIWEITPGEVRSLRGERVPGGTKVTLPEFGLTTALFFTGDLEQIGQLQKQCAAQRKKAAAWTYDLAMQELEKVLRIEEQLQKAGHSIPQSARLIQDAQDRLAATREHWRLGLHGEAYREAQRALRPIRILMRAEWEQAVKDLDCPVASPYAVSYYTLPRHWRFIEEKRGKQARGNVLPGGDFEVAQGQAQPLWTPTDVTLDEVELQADRVGPNTLKNGKEPAVEPKEGKLCLRLQIKPKRPVVPQALERTFLAINSPVVRLPPGTLVQISGWVNIPENITASVDGAMLYDTAGGEPLAVRLTGKTPWKQFTLYRRVPANGTIGVTLALTGIGTVYFDDVRIEPLE